MKLLNDKKEKNILSLYASSSGEILSVSDGESDSALKFHDARRITDILTKRSAVALAMSKSEIVNVETKIYGYKNGLVLKSGTGIAAKNELYLFSDKYSVSNIMSGDAKNLCATVIGTKRSKKRVNICDIVYSVIKSVGESFSHINISLRNESENDEADLDAVKLKALLLSLISLALEVNIMGDIKATIRERNGTQEIVFGAICREEKMLNGMVDFCNAYPFSTTSAVFARTVCNEMKAELSIFQELDYLEILVSFDHSKGDIYEVYTGDSEEDNLLYRMCMSLLLKNKD